ncbi:MAG: hypothetical protein IPJ88_14390 [Myxococcales bacterium]|nr:MAG: hypothetical protein IPJ88_14390 [Myxococcales bacterium]
MAQIEEPDPEEMSGSDLPVVFAGYDIVVLNSKSDAYYLHVMSPVSQSEDDIALVHEVLSGVKLEP